MSKEKPRKLKPSERNQVMWVDRNFKFIREHSAAYPEPAWYINLTKSTNIGAIVLYILFIIAVSVLVAFDFPSIIIAYIGVALYMILFIEIYKSGMRSRKFYTDLLNRGGEIIDPFNLEMINKNATSSLIACAFTLLLIFAYLGIIIYLHINGQPLPSYLYNMFYYPCFYYSIFNTINVSSPFIFMDIDEGMLFGNAMIPYDILSGIHPTGIGNGFELYYEGKLVATGKMLPDDMKYLQDMIKIREKYGDYLTAN